MIDKYNLELYRIIDLLLKDKGFKIKEGYEQCNELEKTQKEDFKDYTKKLLRELNN